MQKKSEDPGVMEWQANKELLQKVNWDDAPAPVVNAVAAIVAQLCRPQAQHRCFCGCHVSYITD